MVSLKSSIFSYAYYYYIITIALIYVVQNEAQCTVYSFGDSTVDPGNNNFIVSIAKGNFPPYGRDLTNPTATRRFSNGRQVPDFIASNSGKNFLRAYLDPLLSSQDLMNPIGFGSAGTGFDPTTPLLLNVIPMTTQARNFRDFKRRLELTIGKTRADETVQKALVFVSSGTVDLVAYYSTNPLRRTTFTIQGYQEFLIQLVREFLQDLLEQGVMRIAVSGLQPIGCIPLVITLYSTTTTNALVTRNCVEYMNIIAQDFNLLLQQELTTLQSRFNNTKIIYFDLYSPIMDIIQNPLTYGFSVVNEGCCGTGLLEQGSLCNPSSITCPDASKYVFWDAVHFTETTNLITFNANRQKIESLGNYSLLINYQVQIHIVVFIYDDA